MIEVLYDLFIDPFKNDSGWVGYALGIVCWFFASIVSFLVLWFLFWIVDSSFMPVKEKNGIVTKKYIRPAHTSTTYIMSGKVMVPIINYIPESYNIEITIDEISDEVGVSEDYYDAVVVGRKVNCQYTNGRIKKSLYIKSFK